MPSHPQAHSPSRTAASGAASPPCPFPATPNAFVEAWREVRVIDATVAPTGRHARAVVQLGRLAPADVEVHAAPRSSASAARDASAAPRLWSSQSYANGSFVFEGDLDEGAGAGGDELLVSVVPSFRWTVSRRAARPCYGPAKRSAVAPSP